MGLAYLTSSLKTAGHDVAVLDLNNKFRTPEQVAKVVGEQAPDYVGLSVKSATFASAVELHKLLAGRFPHITFIYGGPHVSLANPAILDEAPEAVFIRGDAEHTFRDFVTRHARGERSFVDLPGVMYRDESGVHHSEPKAHTREDLEALALPDFSSFDTRDSLTLYPLLTSRGCPYKCIFCVWPATMTGNDPDGTKKRTVRHYSADYMEAFLRELVERFDYRCIYFDDDTFNLGDRHVLAMCEVMTRIGLPWSAMCRADTIAQDTWGAMKASGCFGVKIGFESGNQHVVDEIVNKRLDLERARETVFECKRLGLTVHGTFTYGLPGETVEQMQDTKRFIASLPLDTYQESGTAAIEGTPLDTLLKGGTLERYRGARLDSSFDENSDGSVKMSNLRSTL